METGPTLANPCLIFPTIVEQLSEAVSVVFG